MEFWNEHNEPRNSLSDCERSIGKELHGMNLRIPRTGDRCVRSVGKELHGSLE